MTPWNDGRVHRLVACTIQGSTRIVLTGCGVEMRQRPQDPLWGASGWQSQVDCEACS